MEKGLLNPDAALEIILASIAPLDTQRVGLRDAFGRVLAVDVHSDMDLPPFDNSAMDGYAVLAECIRGASADHPTGLRVIAEQPAGTVVAEQVVPGTAIRIMTGAPIPSGADAVVIVEHTQRQGSDVLVFAEATTGANIRPRGEDVRVGQLVLRAGTRIGPAEMGMLAAVGRGEVSVYRRPKVAIITTGDELVDISEIPGPGKIRDSNQYSTLGQALEAGCEVCMVKRALDERENLAEILAKAAETADVLVTIGGVSVGDYDFVKETLERLGEIKFWKVAVKPGKPLAYGHIDGKPLFGLPGNPVSSMVTFDLFVRPALLRLAGMTNVGRMTVSGRISQDVRHSNGRRTFVRAATEWKDGAFTATPTGNQGSGRLSSMLGANSYVVIGESDGDVAAGDGVDIILLDERSRT